MKKVYCKVSLELLDDLNGFFKKLHDFVGDFTIEGQDKTFYRPLSPMVISFYTDKVKFEESDERLVTLTCKCDENKDWHFSDIAK